MRSVEQPLMLRILLVLSALLVAAAAAGCGAVAQQPALGDAMVESAEIATQSGQFQAPLDSTPDPDATTIYFTATSPKGPGVFRVPAAGGVATELAAGAPLVAPVGIAISSDGRQLYIADPQASQIFVLPVGGGAPSALRGTEGTAPRGMDVVSEGGQDMLYFTGRAPGDGQPAVLKRPAAGEGAPTIVVKGAPLVEPDGITATHAGVLFVADRSAAGGGFGSVFKVDGAAVTKIVDRAHLGDPAGIALTKDESVLLISALQPDRASDQVLLINLSTLQTGSITKGIAENQQAGGVHRARNSNIFSWADRSVRGSGGVYRIGTK
jgi:sugar lactone lactonase YvrE